MAFADYSYEPIAIVLFWKTIISAAISLAGALHNLNRQRFLADEPQVSYVPSVESLVTIPLFSDCRSDGIGTAQISMTTN